MSIHDILFIECSYYSVIVRHFGEKQTRNYMLCIVSVVVFVIDLFEHPDANPNTHTHVGPAAPTPMVICVLVLENTELNNNLFFCYRHGFHVQRVW